MKLGGYIKVGAETRRQAIILIPPIIDDFATKKDHPDPSGNNIFTTHPARIAQWTNITM